MPVQKGLQDQTGSRLIDTPPSAPTPPSLLDEPPFGLGGRVPLVDEMNGEAALHDLGLEGEGRLGRGARPAVRAQRKSQDCCLGPLPFGEVRNLSCEIGTRCEGCERMCEKPQFIGNRHPDAPVAGIDAQKAQDQSLR